MPLSAQLKVASCSATSDKYKKLFIFKAYLLYSFYGYENVEKV